MAQSSDPGGQRSPPVLVPTTSGIPKIGQDELTSHAGDLSRTTSTDDDRETKQNFEVPGIERSSLGKWSAEVSSGKKYDLPLSQGAKHSAKATSSPKRSVVVTHASNNPEEKALSLEDHGNSDSSASQNRSQRNQHDTTAELEFLRNGRNSTHEQTHRAAKRASRILSRSSSPRSDDAGDDGSDAGNQPVRIPGRNEIRLRVNASAPLTFQFNGEMEGRTMQLIPGESGTAELVISGNPNSGYQDRDTRKRREVDLMRDRRSSTTLGTVDSSDIRERLYDFEQERRRQSYKPKVHYQPSTAFNESSGHKFDELLPSRRYHRLLTDRASLKDKERISLNARRNGISAEEYINNQRGADALLSDHSHRATKRALRVPLMIGLNNSATQSRRPIPKQSQGEVYDNNSGSETGSSGEEEVDEAFSDERMGNKKGARSKAPATFNNLRFRPRQSALDTRPRFVPSQSTYDTRPSSGSYLARFGAANRKSAYDSGSRYARALPPVIQPATTRPRRTSIAQLMSYPTKPAPQYRRINEAQDYQNSPQTHLPTHQPKEMESGQASPPPDQQNFVNYDASCSPFADIHITNNQFPAPILPPIHTAANLVHTTQISVSPQSMRTMDQRENDRRESEVHRLVMLPVDQQRTAIAAEAVKQKADKSQHRQMDLDAAFTTTSPTVRYAPAAKSVHGHDIYSEAPTECENMPPLREIASPSDISKPFTKRVSSSASHDLRATLDTFELHKISQKYSSTLDHTPSASSNSLRVSDVLDNIGWMTPELLAEMQPDLVSGSSDAPSKVPNVHSDCDVRGLEVSNRQIVPEAVACGEELNYTAADVGIIEMADDIGLKLPLKKLVHGRDTFGTWPNTVFANNIDVNVDWNYTGKSSKPSSYAASVASMFSVESLASSASDISGRSGYSAVQIATATKVLLSIFDEDKALMSLYKSAIENHNIGPEKLQRNLHRLFRAYAGFLENEATDRLEYLASQLVKMKSAFLAQSIVEKLQNGRVGAQSPRNKHNEESSEEDDDSIDPRPVNEEAFEDLVIFREFLVESEAFRTFRGQLEAFIVQKLTHLANLESERKLDTSEFRTLKSMATNAVSGHDNVMTWQRWRCDAKQSTDGLFHCAHLETTAVSLFHLMVDAIMLVTDDLLIAAGQLEPPLRPNMVRLRWQCACGESLHSDVLELHEGGVNELIRHMQHTSCAKVRASPHSHRSTNQQYVVPHPIQWIRKAFASVFGGSAKKSSAGLPQHNTPCTPSATTVTTSNTQYQAQQSILHLLACMRRNRHRKVLKQDRIEDITTDRALLCFLRKQYRLHRGRFLHTLSLQSVKGISFVKFRLPIGGSVDVRDHETYCAHTSCECIPPPPKVEPSPGAEYRCMPCPPDTNPPMPPVYLASLFTCPTDVHEKDTWILDQLPKRTCGELKGQIGQPAEGWGIYYDEGLDGDVLAWTILIGFFVASLLFGVLWSRFQYDIEGAFGG
ncbi:hypothetical protein G6011_06668 [Alternaria panax]|uniref:Uncharacterized protein n=1 Tax=Alternaria panax TaxID=48097 RepID=A0AAD4FI64_9PLEO|nr:hypothetical protein G6011_06668 [Alternaria panax]